MKKVNINKIGEELERHWRKGYLYKLRRRCFDLNEGLALFDLLGQVETE